MKEIELINLRKKREKHFLQSDGSIIAKVYNEDIHFKRNNEYVEIDNTIIKENNYYRNKENDYQVYFKDSSIDDFMKLIINDHYLDISIVNSNNIIPITYDNNINYENILNGIDLEYQLLSNKIKENIIIKDKLYKKEYLDFIVSTDLDLVICNNNILAQKDNQVIFTLDIPYMIDSSNNTNYNIYYDLVKYDSLYHLKLILDNKWLESATYPVIIDPTITNSGNTNSVYDTYIYDGDTNIDCNNQDILKVGVERVNNQNRVNRALIKFDLPTIGTGSQVVSATLDLIGYGYNEAIYDTELITIHQLTKDWNETTANWNTMNNSYNSRIEAYFNNYFSLLIYNSSTKSYDLHTTNCTADITNLVRKWYSNTPNYGIMLKTHEEVYKSNKVPAFYSKNNTIGGNNPKPILIIKYRNQNGLENYMDYQTQVFSQGNVYINTYTGNLTSLFSLGNTISGMLPASLNLVYNTNDIILNNNYGLGIGYKFNYYQTIKSVIIENINYLEYLDEDGTIHYFVQEVVDGVLSNTKYIDEDGLNMTIEVSNTEYILKDKENNKMKFNIVNGIGYLIELIDLSDNKITINYNTDYKISKIVDANESEITITYNTNSIVINSPDEVITLNYSNNKLTSIISRLGTTFMTYNTNNLIETITDINSIKIKYEYYEQLPYKVSKVLEYGLNDTLGNYFNILYGYDATTIVDNKNRAITKTYNINGNIASISNLTNKDSLYNAYGMFEEYGEEYITEDTKDTQYKNKLLTKRIPIKYINNYLTNSSFENNEILFTPTIDVVFSIVSECANTGFNSLKIINQSINKYIYQDINVDKGKYYTFSLYIKNTNKVRIGLSYTNSNNELIEVFSNKIDTNDDFIREDVTIYYPSDSLSSLRLIIYLDEIGITYIDDIQLEEGEVANNYNMLDNSNFSSLDNWTIEAYNYQSESDMDPNNVFSIVNVDDKTKALKIKMNPINSSSIRKTYNISGKKGDVYNVSFWYKNEGLYASGLVGDLVCNAVTIFFNYLNQEEWGMGTIQAPPFNINDKEWQYYSYSFVALEDFDSFELLFYQASNANDMYINNISLIKDVREVNYDYDFDGNIVTTSNLDNEIMNFNYDSNNQLIKMTEPMGNSFKYEYDNIVTDRVLSGLASNNISNLIEYDEYNNPILTKIINKTDSSISNGNYRIRLKGTNKYIRNIQNQLIVSEDNCYHDLWNFEKVNGYYKIKHNIINNKYISSIKEIKTLENNTNETIYHVLLTNYLDDDSLFTIQKQLNGSYLIYLKDNDIYLKYNDDYQLCFDKLVIDDYHYEFYLETTLRDAFIENTCKYTNDGKFIQNTTNTLLNKVYYDINTTSGLINKVTDTIGNITNYTYDTKERLIQTKYNDRTINYTYNNYNLISKINNNNIEYNLVYDEFLNTKQVKINNNITLITNNYEPNNGNLLSTTYGNNNTISYTYDTYDRINSIIKMNNTYNYKYDNNGNLTKIISNNDTIKYIYDLAKKLHEYRYNNFKIDYVYDSNSNIISRNYTLDTINKIVNNIFINNMLYETNIDNNKITYTYDTLGRITSKNINNILNTDYEYVSLGKRTSTLIKSINNNNDKYSYRYDKLNNIKTIYHNNTLENKYYYDNYNQLIKEINNLTNEEITYTYDTNGNILTKQIKDLTTNNISTNTYEYSNTNWSDQLTKFNNVNITYDEIGNPITIGNDTLTWINGRQLNSYNNITYKYNVSGIRTSKTINNIETKYYLEGTQIIFEQTGNNVIYYIHNEVDGLIGFKYNNEIYYYEKNVQGDIIAIRDSMNQLRARYTYDTWGNILSITDSYNNSITDTDHIGCINPYRYRSYYYDTETNLYYLNSRYYNPVWGRFINADGIVGANQDILSYNLYAYCSNNPVNCSDPKGMFVGDSIVRFTNEAASNAKLASKENVINKTNHTTNTFRKVDNPKCSSTISNSKFDKLTSKSTSINGHGNLPYRGTPGGYLRSPDGSKERWYGDNGFPVRDRHYTDHGNPSKHPWVPHDHDWEQKPDGNWTPGPGYPSPETTEKIILTGMIIYGSYIGIKWIVAGITAPVTGGGSLVVVGLTP